MEPFISKIDYEVPIFKNHIKKNYDKIVKKTEFLKLIKLKTNTQ